LRITLLSKVIFYNIRINLIILKFSNPDKKGSTRDPYSHLASIIYTSPNVDMNFQYTYNRWA